MNIICGKKQCKNGFRQNYTYKNILMKTRNLWTLNLYLGGCGCSEMQYGVQQVWLLCDYFVSAHPEFSSVFDPPPPLVNYSMSDSMN
jgi:hypothetical protein